ncbi:MAG: Crp/Fnr family transcriptional regulator [Phycisphaerae bacterium]
MLSVDALNQLALFVGIQQEDVEAIWALGKVVQHDEGDILFERGGEAHEVLVVESGSVALFFPVPILGAIKEVNVEYAGPGDLLAWSALVSPYTLTLSARCVERGQVRLLPREALVECLKGRPGAGYTLMTNLAAIIGQRLQDAQNLWLREVQARIVARLE